MKLEVELTSEEAFELHTFIRRSIVEDYIRAMNEVNQSADKTNDRVYEVISALTAVRKQIEKKWQQERDLKND
jgi:hypothetical protein